MAASQEQDDRTQKALGWAARDSSGILSPFHFTRRHEIVGVVTQVGRKVNKFKVGDKAAVGCFVGSCGICNSCLDDLESYCPKAKITYTFFEGQGVSYGGFSNIFVVNEHFAVRFPDTLPPEGGAPLLCAGITVYSPMKYFGLNEPGMHLGVVGLGGLGHVAVKFAKAFGMKVTVISTSPNKKEEAIERLGADSFLVRRDTEQIQAATGMMDGIIDTVSVAHPLNPLVDLLKCNGKLILLGLPDMKKPAELSIFPCWEEAYSWKRCRRAEGDTRNDRFCREAQHYCRC